MSTGKKNAMAFKTALRGYSKESVNEYIAAASEQRAQEAAELKAQIDQMRETADAEKAKAEGKIRHLGFSFHDSLEVFKDILYGYDGWEFCQIQLNYLDWTLQDAGRKCELLAERGIPVWVMEPVRGGRNVQAERPEQECALLQGHGRQ